MPTIEIIKLVLEVILGLGSLAAGILVILGQYYDIFEGEVADILYEPLEDEEEVIIED